MRILVIDDSPLHRQSAVETLVGHDLTVVSTFDEAKSLLKELKNPFDVVLTDMMMPISMYEKPRDVPEGTLIAYGFILALMAANHGAKFIAMATDINHHKGGLSNALDHIEHFRTTDTQKPFSSNFQINGAKVMFVHAPMLEDVIGKEPCPLCKATGICGSCNGTTESKYQKGFPCQPCSEHPGTCHLCQGSKEIDELKFDRKDWGQILRDLTTKP